MTSIDGGGPGRQGKPEPRAGLEQCGQAAIATTAGAAAIQIQQPGGAALGKVGRNPGQVRRRIPIEPDHRGFWWSQLTE